MAVVYYNEIDPYCADWLEALIAEGHLPPGRVDRRDIRDVRPADLTGFVACHFFAGIGGWAYALRLAGWPDDRTVWTGSCPCQPFSAAGARKGVADARHLWPEWFRLISECRPPVVFGEQVEAAVGHGWLDLVYADLEGEGYAVGAACLPAASVGAPHQRGRVWFVADARRAGRQQVARGGEDGVADAQYTERGAERRSQQDVGDGGDGGRAETHGQSGARRAVRSVGDPEGGRRAQGGGSHGGAVGAGNRLADAGELGDTSGEGLPLRVGDGQLQREAVVAHARQAALGAGDTFWSPCDWLPCLDGKARPVEPGTFPLAHGVPNRVGRLRAYGNAINPHVAVEFVRVYLACEGDAADAETI